jgi:hypothetical protein
MYMQCICVLLFRMTACFNSVPATAALCMSSVDRLKGSKAGLCNEALATNEMYRSLLSAHFIGTTGAIHSR